MCSAAVFHASYMSSTLYSYMQCNYIGFNIASCLEFLLSAVLFVKLAKCGGVASYMYAAVCMHLSLASPLFPFLFVEAEKESGQMTRVVWCLARRDFLGVLTTPIDSDHHFL